MLRLIGRPVFAVALIFFAVTAFAKDAIVHVSFTDEFAISVADNRFVHEMYSSTFPDSEFIEINVQVPRFLRLPEGYYRRKALAQMKKRILPDYKISHLIISTHGSTSDKKGVAITNLDLIGSFGPKELDKKAREFFAPLIGKFASDAQIFFNSCKIFCGTDPEVKARAETLMHELKIPDGKIYGSEVSVTSMVPPGKYSKADLIFIRKPGLYAFLTMGIFEAAVMSEAFHAHGDPALVLGILPHALFGTGMTMALAVAVTPIIKITSFAFNAATLLSQKSTGKLVSLRSGEISEIKSIHQIRNADAAYGIPFSEKNACQQYLLNFDKPSEDNNG